MITIKIIRPITFFRGQLPRFWTSFLNVKNKIIKTKNPLMIREKINYFFLDNLKVIMSEIKKGLKIT